MMNADERMYSVGFLHPPINNRIIILYKPPFVPKHSIDLDFHRSNIWRLQTKWDRSGAQCGRVHIHIAAPPNSQSRGLFNVSATKSPRHMSHPAMSTLWCHTGSIQVNAV